MKDWICARFQSSLFVPTPRADAKEESEKKKKKKKKKKKDDAVVVVVVYHVVVVVATCGIVVFDALDTLFGLPGKSETSCLCLEENDKRPPHFDQRDEERRAGRTTTKTTTPRRQKKRRRTFASTQSDDENDGPNDTFGRRHFSTPCGRVWGVGARYRARGVVERTGGGVENCASDASDI